MIPPALSTAARAPANTGYRGRFAPSPTGDLHFGSLLAAFGSWLLARAARGEWWVRTEDLDPPREVAGAAQRQLAALAAFGLHSDAPGRAPERARRALPTCDRPAAGRWSRIHLPLQPHRPRGNRRYPPALRRQRRAARSVDPAARRQRTRIDFVDAIQGHHSQDVARDAGDFVLKRTDGHWAYQLAVVVDDAAQGITDVVRGGDLLDSTPRQIALQRALGLPTPRYAHLPLVLGTDGRKLSKSEAARPVDLANPLLALRSAWSALGQDPRLLASARDVPSLLDAARATFDATHIPREPVPSNADLAASHNTQFTIAE